MLLNTNQNSKLTQQCITESKMIKNRGLVSRLSNNGATV